MSKQQLFPRLCNKHDAEESVVLSTGLSPEPLNTIPSTGPSNFPEECLKDFISHTFCSGRNHLNSTEFFSVALHPEKNVRIFYRDLVKRNGIE